MSPSSPGLTGGRGGRISRLNQLIITFKLIVQNIYIDHIRLENASCTNLLPGHPVVRGFTRQYSSTVWLDAHDRHSAVFAVQQGVGAILKKELVRLNVKNHTNLFFNRIP